MFLRTTFFAAVSLSLSVSFVTACSETSAATKPPTEPATPLADASIDPARRDLLELAFETASAMPLDPHVKDRSLAQEKVVVACLELEQPLLAAELVGGIANWRQGTSWADLAQYCVDRGYRTQAREYLDRARLVMNRPTESFGQAWRQDRIRGKVAFVLRQLGEDEEADALEAAITDVEGAMAGMPTASDVPDDQFDDSLAAVSRIMPRGTFEQVRGALNLCARLHETHYDDPDRRAATRELIVGSLDKVPLELRIAMLLGLARTALEHEDVAEGTRLLDQAAELVDGTRWPLDYLLPFEARLAELEHLAGRSESAASRLARALGRFEEEQRTIVDIDRANALREVAAAYFDLGKRDTAIEVYAAALDAGVQNPNSRPRADDLAETCSSMASVGLVPDEALWRRVRSIRDGLGDPW